MGKSDLTQKRDLFWSSIPTEKSDIIKRVLRSGAVQLATTNPDTGMTGLQYAALIGKERSVAAILDFAHSVRGPALSVDLVDEEEGQTALHKACAKGHLGVVRLLLNAGASRTIKDENGKLARDLAVEGKFLKIVDFLDHGDKEEEEEEVGDGTETSTQRSREKKKAIKEQSEKLRLAAIAAGGGAAAIGPEGDGVAAESSSSQPSKISDGVSQLSLQGEESLSVDWQAQPKWEELRTHLATGRLDVTLNKLDLSEEESQVDPALFRCTSITRLALRMPEGKLTQISECLGALTHLTTLILSRNSLSILPSTTIRLGKTLRVLEISHNKLQELPPGLANLEVLDASFNQLSSIAPISETTTLLTLNLDANKLTGALPLCYSGLRRLATLSAAQNQLSSMHYGIGLLTNLTELNLADNRIVNIPTEFSDLSEKKLKSIFLDNNPLKDPRVKKILEKGKQPVKELIAHVKKVDAPRKTEDGSAPSEAQRDSESEEENEEKEQNSDDDEEGGAAAMPKAKRGGGGKKGKRRG